MILDATLPNTQHYEVQIKGKQGKEWHSPLHLGVVAIEKGAFRLPSTKVGQLTYINISIYTHTNLPSQLEL